MTEEKIKQFQTEYMELYDEELAVALENTPNGESLTVKAFINRVERLIMTLINSVSPTFDKDNLSEYQQEQIWNALLEQAYYTINVGDFSIFSGVDFTTNTFIDDKALQRRIYSSIAVDILKSSGLLYTGLSRGVRFW